MKAANIHTYHDFKEVEMAHAIAIHALKEYREWRDNAYIGQNLGPARNAYVKILRRRVMDALEAYKLVRATARPLLNQAA